MNATSHVQFVKIVRLNWPKLCLFHFDVWNTSHQIPMIDKIIKIDFFRILLIVDYVSYFESSKIITCPVLCQLVGLDNSLNVNLKRPFSHFDRHWKCQFCSTTNELWVMWNNLVTPCWPKQSIWQSKILIIDNWNIAKRKRRITFQFDSFEYITLIIDQLATNTSFFIKSKM